MLRKAAWERPDKIALTYRKDALAFGAFDDRVDAIAAGMVEAGIRSGDRVAIYLDKNFEFAIALVACMRIGAMAVPINPLLKNQQAGHILANSQARAIITTGRRSSCMEAASFEGMLIRTDTSTTNAQNLVEWSDLEACGASLPALNGSELDPAAILYTSGSTGAPKGVVLSHRNLVAGAQSVNAYLGTRSDDTILSVLPMSFDAGLSQLTTAIDAQAKIHLLTFLVADEVVAACREHAVTSITGVPPLWHRLTAADWDASTAGTIRTIANTGGHMPAPLLGTLRRTFPKASPYLMYGLTEAFRSTYLDPMEVERRPNSIGKAVPNADVRVLREDGTEADSGEIGELVHRGAFVTLGYWRAPEATAARFRPVPDPFGASLRQDIAVWSGDLVRRDDDGFLYFIGRRDGLIKTSGYRVSATDIEEALLAAPGVSEAVAFGVPHPTLGQAIVALYVASDSHPDNAREGLDAIGRTCARSLPNYAVPHEIVMRADLPRNPNGKIDRPLLEAEYRQVFATQSTLEPVR
ncbi:acyl-CoA ligase (AMP-forming), exosortase A system-associated [Nguyenibacter vanlangensis]|uniref:Acyl-CoA ligase (AMP-forming), exosortase A system-associated n=2 Tax=Nguyenibacter vanlangensis TaxID=1216886 RepID=A0A7Y7IT03_9PROT|nr:acyl-CoA ligase (AMP-forming), exosortase A system-associated [Nguyenibacter vanlangensis]